MPIVAIQITREGVTPEQKAALIKGATDLLVDVLNRPPGLTFVIIEEVDVENWGRRGAADTGIPQETGGETVRVPMIVTSLWVGPDRLRPRVRTCRSADPRLLTPPCGPGRRAGRTAAAFSRPGSTGCPGGSARPPAPAPAAAAWK